MWVSNSEVLLEDESIDRTEGMNLSDRQIESLWAMASMILSLLVAVVVWHLWDANLRIPIFPAQGDAAWTIASIKGIMQHGWYESNSSLAAPFGQLNYDFPAYVGEFGKALMVKLFALVLSNPAAVANLILLAGFPLIALPAFLVLRQLSLSRTVSLVGAVLFATSPVHFFLATRQAFIAIYAGIPLSAYLILAVLGERALFARRQAPKGGMVGAWLSRRSGMTIIMCILVGCLGLNYAEFTCLLVGLSGILMFILNRRMGILVKALVVVVLITAPVVGSAVPDLAYRVAHGTNVVAARRAPVETFIYGLQPVQLILPQIGDRLPLVGELTAKIDHDLEQNLPGVPINLGPQVSLGLVSAAGLLWLLVVLLGGALGRFQGSPLARQSGVATLLAVLVAMTGGGSVLFAYVVTATLQVWARISVLIAFFAVIGVGLLLERGCLAIVGRTKRSWWGPVLAALVLAAGVVEGTSGRFVPNYQQLAAVWTDDAQFVAQVQHSLPRNAMVLELPYVKYPEAELSTGLTSYEPLIPYFHSTALRWSGGAMEGRPTDWLASASSLPTDKLVRDAVASGFSGVYILRNGYADQGAATMGAIQELTGIEPMIDADGTGAFFDLLPYARKLHMGIPASQLAAIRQATIYPPVLEYRTGFYEAEASAGEPRWMQQKSVLVVTNPAKDTQVVTYSAVLATGYPQDARVDITWPDNYRTTILASNKGTKVSHSIVLHPGSNSISFDTSAPRVNAPGDSRMLYLLFRKASLATAANS